MTAIAITSIRALSDNFIHIVHDSKFAAAIDPSSAAPVLDFVRNSGLTLSHILLTHHHADHTGGCPELKRATQCTVCAPADRRIALVDETLNSSTRPQGLFTEVQVLETPGHTSTHICFFLPQIRAVFTGDTLFLGGCGRLFEGSPTQMWQSLLKLRALPPATMIYPGHDYTLDNLKFCLAVLPGNQQISERIADIQSHNPPDHSPLATENKTNVFLMCDDADLMSASGLQGTPENIFAELRRRKDEW